MGDAGMTKELFSVGEIAIFVPETNPLREVKIVEPLVMRDWSAAGVDFKGATGGLTYMMEDPFCPEGPRRIPVYPEQLRKKRPPRDDLKVVRWDQCPWQPEKIHV